MHLDEQWCASQSRQERGVLKVTIMKGKSTVAAANPASDQLVGILRDTIVALVRRDGPDLSARQLGVFLTCYLQEGAHTVRGLAADLNVSKPAITRALDRLAEFDLIRRKIDPLDRRSVLVQRTATGQAFMRDLRSILRSAAQAKPEPAVTNGRNRHAEMRPAH